MYFRNAYVYTYVHTKTINEKKSENWKRASYLGREVKEETNNIMTLQFQKIKK